MAWTGTALSIPFTLYLVMNFPCKERKKERRKKERRKKERKKEIGFADHCVLFVCLFWYLFASVFLV